MTSEPRTPSTPMGKLVAGHVPMGETREWFAADIALIEEQARSEAESSLRARLVAEVRALGPNDCGEPASTNEPRTFASGTGVGMAMMKSAVLQVLSGTREG